MEPFQAPPPAAEVSTPVGEDGPATIAVGQSVGTPQVVSWPKFAEIPVEDQTWKWVLFSHRGRLERKRYIIASISILGAIITMWVGWLILFVLAGGFVQGIEDDIILIFLILLIPMGLITLSTIWTSAVMAMKRLRDMDQEPGLAFLFIFVPLVPWIGGLIQFGMWIWLMVQEGTRGQNQYGPPSALFQRGLELQAATQVQHVANVQGYSK